jgi:hypothetical protein
MTTLRNRGNDAWDVRALDTTLVQRENPVQRQADRSRAGTAEMDFIFTSCSSSGLGQQVFMLLNRGSNPLRDSRLRDRGVWSSPSVS